MKASIKFTALLLLAGASVFAAVPAKAVVPTTPPVITFSSLPSQKGIEVKVKNEPGKAIVTITDNNGEILRRDVLSNAKGLQKGYILTSLDNGDYSIEVAANGNVVKEDIHVYDEGDTKMFIVKS
jgi:hypothetical protein